MDREEYLASYCSSIDCTCKKLGDCDLCMYEKGRADVIDELKPFFEESSQYVFDWICDDICGEFINPETDECWCAEHCDNGTGYECIKKWCEWKRLKEQNNG